MLAFIYLLFIVKDKLSVSAMSIVTHTSLTDNKPLLLSRSHQRTLLLQRQKDRVEVSTSTLFDLMIISVNYNDLTAMMAFLIASCSSH
jgi:hypothetical protein